jgi:adenylate cyclase
MNESTETTTFTAATSLIGADLEELDAKQLRAAFNRLRRFVAPNLVDLIVRDCAESLAVHRRAVTVVFFDLRGFTSFAEVAEPEEVILVLREYHQVLGQLVTKYGGTLERFTGDGIMVFFNDPVPVADPQAQAIALALAVHESVGALAQHWRGEEVELGLAAGISHGFATVGLIGSEERCDYAAIGTVTNLAARLCARAQAGETLVCARVMSAVENLVAAAPLGRLALPGFARPVEVFRIIGPAPAAN